MPFLWRSIRGPAFGQSNGDHFLIVCIDLLPGHVVRASAAAVPVGEVLFDGEFHGSAKEKAQKGLGFRMLRS